MHEFFARDPIVGGLIRPDMGIQDIDVYLWQVVTWSSVESWNEWSTTIITTSGHIFKPDWPQGISWSEAWSVSWYDVQSSSQGQPYQEEQASWSIKIWVEELFDSVHSVGYDYEARIAQVCREYETICDIVALDGSYTVQQRYAYYVMIVYVVDALQNKWYDPLVSLGSITVNNYTKHRRWYANARLIVLNTQPMRHYKEFAQVLVHELWHVVDLGVLLWWSRQINTSYTEFGKAKFAIDDPSLPFYALSWVNENTMRARMRPEDFVSGYAMTNPFEDFAESHHMYLYHRDVFAYMASSSRVLQQKYDYFDRMYQSRYLSINHNPINLANRGTDDRPWDTTRM